MTNEKENRTVSKARSAAMRLLAAFERDKSYSDIAIRDFMRHAELDIRDTALCSRIFYGTVENIMYLDYIINSISSVKVKKMHPVLRAIVRSALYQIIFCDKLPIYAIVNDAVNLTKMTNPRASSLVNAVMRKSASFREEPPEVHASEPEEKLSLKYSHPAWIVGLYTKYLGIEDCERELALNNSPTPVYIRCNTLKCNIDMLEAALCEEGATLKRDPDVSDMAVLDYPGNMEESKAYLGGLFTVQDKSSRLSVLLGNPKEGERVIDVCAAPGGKSFTAAEMMKNKGEIISFDKYDHKIELIKNGASRLGIDIIRTECYDSTSAEPSLVGSADLVIADVPCSGIGIIAKKPDIRYKGEASVKALPELQLKILTESAKYVKRGGRIVYSTCTVNQAENEDVVNVFLAENKGFKPENAELPEKYRVKEGRRTLWRHIDGTDGFFFCRMIRIK